MTDSSEEWLNVYDAEGRVTGARPRREAKASGLAVGAVNALVVNGRGEVLLQRRPKGKENGDRWDKTVGGHVSAGESFDSTLLREAGEELFDDPHATDVRLAGSEEEFDHLLATLDLRQAVLLRRTALQRNLRDVRWGPDGVLRNVLYHVAVYVGRTERAVETFRPQPSEIEALRYFPPEEVDRMLVEGRLAPNMGFAWLTQAADLLRLAARGAPPGPSGAPSAS
jgi:isopentenyldiphosphate isomerase